MTSRLPLSVMVKNLRSEAGHALSLTQGTNAYETLKYLLARTQEELWTAFIWPELKVREDMQMLAGQFTYSLMLPFDSIRQVWASTTGGINTNWSRVDYGFPDEDMIRSDGTNSERSDPVRYWEQSTDPLGTANFRVWPTPNTSTALVRLVGQQPLDVFIADSDTSTLDSTLIVLFAAADLLARAKAEDASLKMQKAQRHLVKMLGNRITAKNRVSSLGGGAPSFRSFGINRHLISQG